MISSQKPATPAKASHGNTKTSLIRFCLSLLLFAAFFLCACVREKGEALTLARPDRGYVHWLSSQAMHNQARELLGEVSQSEKMWLGGEGSHKTDTLLAAAPSWLVASGPKPLFSFWASHVSSLPATGIDGLWLGQTGEASELWLEAGSGGVTALQFSPDAGDDKAYATLAEAAEAAAVQLGSDLPGSATGLGPDFILQTRMSPGSAGIYAMLEIPENLWKFLPNAANEWDCKEIAEEAKAMLVNEGVIPETLERDTFTWATPGGWAATGEITGIDGKSRRWLYRFSETPADPVLMWADPFGQARRILAAAIIRQTGLQGQSLTGLRMEGLLGLEPGLSEGASPSLAPGLEAINDLASQIHRYGGWAIQADPVPEEVIAEILGGPCDFCVDDVATLLAIAALASQDSGQLARLYRNRLKNGTNFKRLARGVNSSRQLPIRLAAPETRTLLQAFTGKTPASLNEFQDFLTGFQAGQPGLCFLEASGRDGQALTAGLSSLLAERKNTRLALGELMAIFKNGKSDLGLLTRLPDNGLWLAAMNFSSEPIRFSGTLPASPVKVQSPDAPAKKLNLDGRHFNISLDGRQCVNVIFSVK